jgi:large subunit ribosomal protein L31
MAKKGIHPDYHDLTLGLSNGSEIKTKSTFGKSGDKMILEVDLETHPAWRADGGNFVNEGSANVAKFRKKYGNLNLAALMQNDTDPA